MNTIPSYPIQSLRKEDPAQTRAVTLKVDLAGTASRLQRLVKKIDIVRNNRCEEDLDTFEKKEIELAGAKRILADRESLINRLEAMKTKTEESDDTKHELDKVKDLLNNEIEKKNVLLARIIELTHFVDERKTIEKEFKSWIVGALIAEGMGEFDDPHELLVQCFIQAFS